MTLFGSCCIIILATPFIPQYTLVRLNLSHNRRQNVGGIFLYKFVCVQSLHTSHLRIGSHTAPPCITVQQCRIVHTVIRRHLANTTMRHPSQKKRSNRLLRNIRNIVIFVRVLRCVSFRRRFCVSGRKTCRRSTA